MKWSVFVLVLCSLCCAWAQIVTINQGTLKGTQIASRGGKKIQAFFGIPFAKPPLGDLRFKNPVPHPGWTGVRDASQEGSICVQEMILIPALNGIPLGKEDCLVLNVFIPELKPAKKLPVMVWIYGGGFQMGGSDSETYGPHYFMDREVVFVSFNYRLGTFGFLSFEDPNLSGNFGLKDQQLALQWVKENIEAFGGDPDSITIFGESAGAASVHYHLVSPKSQGLFHRAIMQSGSTFCPWAMIPSGIAKQRAEAFATLLGCHGTVEEVGDCLRQIPSDAILKTQLKFVEWGIDPMISFAPVIEPEHPEAFITQHPYLYKTSADIPLVIGFNSDEGAIRTSKLCADNMLEFNQLNEQWERYLPIALVLNDKVDKQDLPRVKSELKNFYLGGNKAQVDNIRNMSDIFSDVLINHCVFKAAEHHSGPVYFYMYSYLAKISWTSVFGNCSIPLGVSHADELISLFNLDSLFPDNNLEGKDLEMSKTMVALWANFAAKGIPTDDAGTIQWSTFDARSSQDYLDFGQNEISLKQKPFEERLKFIESLPLHLKQFSKSSREQKTEL
uniref:Carboxylic ester hydrolase n=3 Tax=Cacopsylla melanoneura TaxID=428564 RepID=A0A8D8PL90_9HEMI